MWMAGMEGYRSADSGQRWNLGSAGDGNGGSCGRGLLLDNLLDVGSSLDAGRGGNVRQQLPCIEDRSHAQTSQRTSPCLP